MFSSKDSFIEAKNTTLGMSRNSRVSFTSDSISFDAETLRDAQKHPERYEDLQIRVCGWNVLWNNINKKEQDGFIRQAESLI